MRHLPLEYRLLAPFNSQRMRKECFNVTWISLAWYMIISPRRMIVERLIRHFRASEYRDSWKRATTLKPNKRQQHDIKSHSYKNLEFNLLRSIAYKSERHAVFLCVGGGGSPSWLDSSGPFGLHVTTWDTLH